MSLCRSLTVNESFAWLLHLAGPQLQSLSYAASISEKSNSIIMPHVARLTALTKLELAHIHGVPQPANLHSLRQLGLLELRIMYCDKMAEALVVPGALPALQILHLEGRVTPMYKSLARSGILKDTPEFHEFGKALLALPDLVEVSGYGRLFVSKILEGCKEWKFVSREMRLPFDRNTVWRRVR